MKSRRDQGFAVLPGYLPAEVLRPALAELELMFPSPQAFHDGSDPRRQRFLEDEFAGIDSFPFASTEISLLAVHDLLIDLARTLLEDDDLRLYTAEAWAKYTGAADYDQALHRDYLNHTVTVPSADPRFRQLEMFVYLVDVPEELGPPHLVPRTRTTGFGAKPNWLVPGPADIADDFVEPGHAALYAHEVSAAGPAGTVVAFETGTFHRGTGLSRPGGARYSMQLGYRRAEVEWGHRTGWVAAGHEPAWYRFVERATPRQLALFGFPPPGHPFWTEETLAGTALRYPGLDLSPWRSGQRRDHAEGGVSGEPPA
ncbi:hypothetical protein JOF41_002635 [Saccharothrix coeruleofusca]|uniref:phytanoyl-CoA dioxygenase family protein n=1 Tax=Saccharothrix coeruleofusca TaxID=33919 RepID=UPI001AEB044B|nr:phytanoyl-CoA dioxygenase family protein [Saccharothrix coeruleofusca]MBP2336457.1 hypothetical protein [Saccharothrix coeruleofusca]